MAKTYVLECPDMCSFGPGTKWGIRVTEAMLEGRTYRSIVEMAAKEGDKIYPGTMSRHRKHIVITGRGTDDAIEAPNTRYQANNIEILETIIQKGFQNQKNWKPTISDTMKAMDMWFRLTQGNPFDDLLNTLASAAIGEESNEPENPQAVRALGEGSAPMFEEEEEQVAVKSSG